MAVKGINFLFSVGGDDKKILPHGFSISGNIILKKGNGGLFLIFSKQKY